MTRSLLRLNIKLQQLPAWVWVVVILGVYGIVFFFSPYVWPDASTFLADNFYNRTFLIYVGVGIGAQLIDGALGMAYGVSASSFLMATGVTPAVASASVHVSEVFTTGASALSHFRMKNVKGELFKKMVLPGMLGAGIGAYVLTNIDGNIVKPFVSAYLLVMGVIIIRKAFALNRQPGKIQHIGILALIGGFLDSIGGGGWGPVVNSTLLGTGGHEPKHTIGTVNTVEFFVTSASAGIFTLFMGMQNFTVIGGLVVGGVVAAPVGAVLVGKIRPKVLMIMVGALVIFLSLRTLVKYVPW
jgi:uncharacterized protein